jgi:acetaldehyde dehydrogenase / alcohol dehydrogenase
MKTTNAEKLIQQIERIREAQRQYATFTQEQVDEIFRKAAIAANNARIQLAKMAVEETGMGQVEDKVIKNHFASKTSITNIRTRKPAALLRLTKPSVS